MAESLMDSLVKTSATDTGFSLGLMVLSMMENLSMDNDKDMESTDLQMVGNMLARGMLAAILDLVLVPGKVG